MTMNPRWLAVVLFLTVICAPASLMAAGSGDGNPTGPPPITYPSPLPPDGNPTGPPKLVLGQ